MKKIIEFFKEYWIVAIVLFIVAFLMGRFSCGPAGEYHDHGASVSEENIVWTCSMHPQIRQPNPGKCPICAMDLIPIENSGDEKELTDVQLKLSRTAMQLANIQTAVVQRKSATKEIRLYGKVRVDETRQKSITSWVQGRIEKLYVDFTGATVRKGDPLVEIYSPELYVSQQEYLNLKNSSNQFIDMSTMHKKLELLGLSAEQIVGLDNRGTASEFLTIVAPIGGVVINKNIQQGEYVKTGTLLYDIADLASVWIYLDGYEKDIPYILAGQNVSFNLEAYPGETFTGKIEFVEPILDGNTRTVKVRATAQNKNGKLLPGLLVHATIRSNSTSKVLVIPASAPLQTGKRSVVYVDLGNGKFEGREVTLGARLGEYYAVHNGLAEGENVVVNGNFKIDSEMQIRAKKSMMNLKGELMNVGHSHGEQPNPTNSLADHNPQNVFSPMDSDSHNRHDPGESLLKKGPSEISESFLTQLDEIYRLYFKVQKAFSHDKLENGRAPAKKIADNIFNIKSDLGNHQSHFDMLAKNISAGAENISIAQNIAIARSEFFKMSNALLEISTVFGTSGNVTIKQFHCPMAFNNTGADWLQDFDGVENPYFGAAMFSCGSLEKTFVNAKGGDK